MGNLGVMRVIDHALVTATDGETSSVTLAVTVPWLRGQPVYHVFHRADGVLTFHRSYTRADVIGWPNQRRPGRYRHPQPAAAAVEDFRVTVDGLRSAAAADSAGPSDAARPYAADPVARHGACRVPPDAVEESDPPPERPAKRSRGTSVA